MSMLRSRLYIQSARNFDPISSGMTQAEERKQLETSFLLVWEEAYWKIDWTGLNWTGIDWTGLDLKPSEGI